MTLAVTEDEVRRILAESPFIGIYGFQLHSLGDGESSIQFPYQEKFLRTGDVISGPVYMAAADATMWLAIMTKLGDAATLAVTVEMKTNFLSGAKREGFICTAKILKLGARLIYGVAECVSDSGKLLTHHTVTYIRASS